jgi:hypothetical protein
VPALEELWQLRVLLLEQVLILAETEAARAIRPIEARAKDILIFFK